MYHSRFPRLFLREACFAFKLGRYRHRETRSSHLKLHSSHNKVSFLLLLQWYSLQWNRSNSQTHVMYCIMCQSQFSVFKWASYVSMGFLCQNEFPMSKWVPSVKMGCLYQMRFPCSDQLPLTKCGSYVKMTFFCTLQVVTVDNNNNNNNNNKSLTS